MTTHRRKKIRMRFSNLSSEMVENLKLDFTDAVILKKERINGKFIVLLELNDAFDYDKILEFIKKWRIPKRSCTLRASIVTERYSDGILIPKNILRLACSLGCGLNFSFTKV